MPVKVATRPRDASGNLATDNERRCGLSGASLPPLRRRPAAPILSVRGVTFVFRPLRRKHV